MPLVIDTLGACLDDNYQIALYCENYRSGVSCGFVKWLDLEKLVARLGRDHSSMRDDLLPHLWCPKCGSGKVSIRLHPPTGDDRDSSASQQAAMKRGNP